MVRLRWYASYKGQQKAILMMHLSCAIASCTSLLLLTLPFCLLECKITFQNVLPFFFFTSRMTNLEGKQKTSWKVGVFTVRFDLIFRQKIIWINHKIMMQFDSVQFKYNIKFKIKKIKSIFCSVVQFHGFFNTLS